MQTALFRLGGVPDRVSLIFQTARGLRREPRSGPNLRREFARILKRAEIPVEDDRGRTVDIHALRATATTHMLRHGMPVERVAQIIGHADVRMTLKHYEDLRVEDVERALESVPELGPVRPTAGPEQGLRAVSNGSIPPSAPRVPSVQKGGPATQSVTGPYPRGSEADETRTRNPQIDSLVR